MVLYKNISVYKIGCIAIDETTYKDKDNQQAQ